MIGNFTNFVEMERMQRIVSVLLMVLIGCVTVFQCHHHDADGNAFFLTYGDDEVTAGFHYGDCHSGDCGGTHRDDPEGCGMHLTEAMVDNAVRHVCDIAVLICPAADFCCDLSTSTALCDIIPWGSEPAGNVTAGCSHVNVLRGPPAGA